MGVMKRWDAFISHASEDKEAVALPLAEALTKAGLRVWLDRTELRIGDSLRRKIEEGLAESRFGIVILSKSFLSKDWPQKELDGLMAIEEAGRKVVLPVWHEITKAALVKRYPILADRLAADTAHGMAKVAYELIRVIRDTEGGSPPPAGRPLRDDRRTQIRKRLLDYARRNLISDRLLTQALDVLKLRPDQLHAELQKRNELLQQLADQQLTLGDFIDEWNLPAAPETPSPPKPAETQGTPRPGEVRTNSQDGQPYVWIPPGSFQMGCSPSDSECDADEKPPHPVTIARGFWMGQTPVTVGAYKKFAKATGRSLPSAPSFPQDDTHPVVNVDWEDAKAYCTWAGGRLPTEAEWEYAARSGSTAARLGELDQIAWYAGNSGGHTHPVATKAPNQWGLYDVLGNVWEWCADWFDPEWYQKREEKDPSGPPKGELRVLRGGSWDLVPRVVRVSFRGWSQPVYRFGGIGFRCGREVIP